MIATPKCWISVQIIGFTVALRRLLDINMGIVQSSSSSCSNGNSCASHEDAVCKTKCVTETCLSLPRASKDLSTVLKVCIFTKISRSTGSDCWEVSGISWVLRLLHPGVSAPVVVTVSNLHKSSLRFHCARFHSWCSAGLL